MPALWGAIQGRAYRAELLDSRVQGDVVLADGKLPAGLTLSTRGVLSGTPTVAGEFKFRADLKGANHKDNRNYLLIVSPVSAAYGPAPQPAGKGTRVTRCRSAPFEEGGSYVLGANVGSDPSQTCLTLARGTRLDLAGYTVRGRIALKGNPSGASIFNGHVDCEWSDHEGDVGCIAITGDGAALDPFTLHDLRITNRAETSRGIHIDWPLPESAASPSIRLYGILQDVGSQPQAARAYAVSVLGRGQYVAFYSNDITCTDAARACQGVMCYGVAQCKVHHNRITMRLNITDENGRAILFDGGTRFGEAWNNQIVANNNRAVRIRDSSNIRVHDNRILSVMPDQNGVGAIHLGDPDEPGSNVNELQSRIDHNEVEVNGGNVVFARAVSEVEVRDNSVRCIGACPAGTFARLRTGKKTEVVFKDNKLTGFAAPEILLERGTRAIVCHSGSAAGEGETVQSPSCDRKQ